MVGMKEQHKHECGYVDCPSCHEYVKAKEHKCYVQIAKSPQQEKEEKGKKKKKTKRGAAAGLATLAANGEPMDIDGDEEKPPLHVFFDIREFTKPRRRRQRRRHGTKGLMSRTIAVHVRYNSWYISLPSSARRRHEMTKFCVV